MKNSTLIIIASLLFTLNTNAQEKGYFGKNTFIEVGASGQLPLFQNIFFEKGYVGSPLKKSFNLPDYTFKASLMSTTGEYSASGLEFNLRNYYISPQKGDEVNRQILNEDGTVTSESVNARVAFMPVQEIVLLPKIIFSTNSRVPSGLTQELGVGYSMIRLTNLHPTVEVGEGSAYSSDEISKDFVDMRMEELKGMVVNYGIRMNYPINKSMLFHFGFRYQYAFMLGKKKYKDYEYSENWFSGREIWSLVNQRRQLGIISFGAGLTFCF